MSETTFNAEQLSQVARADMRQTEVLREWLLIARDRECNASDLTVLQLRPAA